MNYQYQIKEKDLLEFQIYTASKSERINRKKNTGRIIMTLISVFLLFKYYSAGNTAMTVYFSILTLAVWVLYPRYFKWRYTKMYRSFIIENYASTFNQNELIEISKDSVHIKNNSGEGKINSSEIESIIEVQNYFYVKLTLGTALIAPKNQVSNYAEIIDYYKELGIPYVNELNWKWI